MRFMSASPTAALTPLWRRTKTKPGPLRLGSGLWAAWMNAGLTWSESDGSGSHRRVVGEVAGAADCGECGGAGDDQLEGREVERGGVRGAERTDDGVANVFVQERKRAGTQDDLVVVIDRMSGEDRWSDGRVVVTQEDGDGLAVDLNREIVVPGPGRNVRVAVEGGEGLWGDDIFRGQRVAPVPPVQCGA